MRTDDGWGGPTMIEHMRVCASILREVIFTFFFPESATAIVFILDIIFQLGVIIII